MKGTTKKTLERLLFLCSFVLSSIRTSTTLDTVTPSQPISDGQTIVSPGESFELGFFSPGSSRNRYLGIWYKKISMGTVVWVANREAPLFDHLGVLKVTAQGNLVLLNSTKGIVWSSNTSRAAENIPDARLLESGNLVVEDGNDDGPDKYLWQSFDYPCDTLLPGMKLGRNLASGFDWFLSSWKSTDDPAHGDFTFRIDLHGVPQLVLKKGSVIQFRAGSWNGIRWSGAQAMVRNPVYTYEFVSNETYVYYKYELLNSSVFSRMVLNASGVSQRFTWIDRSHSWVLYYVVIVDQCDNYAFCGAYASCNINKSPVCSCLQGFEPKSPRDWSFLDWSDGCARRTLLDCDKGDGFLKHAGVKLPDTTYASVNKSIGLEKCGELCSNNCSCTAYANSDVRGGGSGCILWFRDLIDIREFSDGGQDLYIRVAASELGNIGAKRSSNDKKLLGIIFGSVIFIAMLAIGLILYIRKKKAKTKNSLEKDCDDEDENEVMELPIFDMKTIIKATENFSIDKKLGEGGFGTVYKGNLNEGQEIAVKRLSQDSGQGLKEFKNEVILIAKLQHRNLVKLLGCCVERDERMLIYEYMPNKSLDYFIFDESRRKELDWHNRINIINGIARGLLYLHQDSRLRIIHRDLKASNVLLDSKMDPKISDFGLARMFGGDETEANTKKVVGTYGYMSPEYAIDGLFSVKSDVFSFGVLVLEIVSGRKNRGFNHPDHQHNLLGHAWRLWMEERPLELIDDILGESCALSEVLRCIHVALLCVQQRPDDRPSMSTVVLMFGSDTMLPQPKQPGFFTERNVVEAESSASKNDSSTKNQITISLLEPR
uniref:Receptor-like serine/threonine-protein kinase n=1 Tax=Populus trichocarpa TaxID=3694 RepID=A0A2K1R9M9_POPTR|eukprot:XP_024447874.1 G-type lectin S-receptor-like serine/threonine-protein kinase At4g27290 [Populus trichocarpa]